jgi:hypothetical protein
MTTESELRELLVSEAGGPHRRAGAGWDEVVRRGRHHRRAARVRVGLAAGGLAVVAVLGALALGDRLDDEDGHGVVAEQPDGEGTTVPPTPSTSTTPTTTSTPATTAGTALVAGAKDLTAARAGGLPEITLLLEGSDPSTGYDPCTATGPLLADGDPIRISVVPADRANGSWSTCRPHAFGSVGTVALGKPVRERQVVDGSDGVPLRVVDQALLLYPAELPARYAGIDPVESGGEIYESETLDSWTFTWIQDDIALSLSRWALDGEHPEGCVDGDVVDVRGAQGRACTGEGSAQVRLLSWTEDEEIFIVELSDVSGDGGGEEIDLVALARALQPFE